MPNCFIVKTGRATCRALVLAFLIPVIVGAFLFGYARYYGSIAKTHDCYPVENCRWDVDGDGVIDRLTLTTEPNLTDLRDTRLRIFISSNNHKREVLNIEYVHIDNSLRTHVAFFVEGQARKLVIYDTANENQFFYWDGQRFQPHTNPSTLETTVRKAMALQDDTGGHHTQILVGLAFVATSIVYYLLILLVTAWLAFSRRAKLP
ncbi:MAG: hypothetical protein PSX80_04705 [bacterium]|nr:hypothetical protein [bacterium]